MQGQLDSVLADLFSQLADLEPEKRFQVSGALLSIGDLEAPEERSDVERILAGIEKQRGSNVRGFIEGYIVDVRERLGSLGAKYLSTNYWSPAVRHRQSAVACDPSFKRDVQRKRFAIAFFDITWEAEQRSARPAGRYWSLVNYLAHREGARRPCVTKTIFGPRADRQADDPGSMHAVLHIDNSPKSGALFVTALPDHVARLCEQAEELNDEEMLSDCLRKGHPSKRSIWLEKLCDSYEQVFAEALQQSSTEALADLDETTRKLKICYSDIDLTRDQVAFLMTMQALWHRAFHGEILYALPTLVNRERSILTAADINDDLILLGGFGRSLFSNLLFLDYGSWRGTAERRAYQSFVAHNLPKLVFAPAAAELRVIERDFNGSGTLPEGGSDLIDNIRHIKSLLEHYESLMGRFRAFRDQSDRAGLSSEDQFVGLPTRQETVEYSALRARIVAIFEVLRDRVLDPGLRQSLRLDAPETELRFSADFEFMIEILVNLISNAIDAIDPSDVNSDPARERAQIKLEVRRIDQDIQFAVTDKGKGFGDQQLGATQDWIKKFADGDKFGWKTLLEEIVSDQYAVGRSLEKSGLGMPLSIAYLSQLKWDPLYGSRPGRMEIRQNSEGYGTIVTVTIPQSNGGAAIEPAPSISQPQESENPVRLAILTSAEESAEEWRGALGPGQAFDWIQDPRAADKHDIVVVDAKFSATGKDFSSLPETALDLMKLFRDRGRHEELPPSVQALKFLAQRRMAVGKPAALIFACEEEPVPALVQELVLAGADYICTRSNRAECAVNISAIYEEAVVKGPTGSVLPVTRQRGSRPGPILVVENSRSVCFSLRKRLESITDLHFVGSDLSGNDFKVEAEMIVPYYEKLRERGAIGAIISDLELDETAENKAAQSLSRGRRPYLNLNTTESIDDSGAVSTFRNTVAEIRRVCDLIRESDDPPVKVIFLSDFTRYADVSAELSKNFADIDFIPFAKSQRGFEDLERTIKAYFEGH